MQSTQKPLPVDATAVSHNPDARELVITGPQVAALLGNACQANPIAIGIHDGEVFAHVIGIFAGADGYHLTAIVRDPAKVIEPGMSVCVYDDSKRRDLYERLEDAIGVCFNDDAHVAQFPCGLGQSPQAEAIGSLAQAVVYDLWFKDRENRPEIRGVMLWRKALVLVTTKALTTEAYAKIAAAVHEAEEKLSAVRPKGSPVYTGVDATVDPA